MLIGQDLIRADGPAKVTGQARYVDDVRPDGCLYGFTVRSPRRTTSGWPTRRSRDRKSVV